MCLSAGGRLQRHSYRIVHFVLCAVILLPLLLCSSKLHDMLFKSEDLAHATLYLSFFAATQVAYLITSFIDPGYLTEDEATWFRHRRGQLSETSADNDSAKLRPGPTEVDDQQELGSSICSWLWPLRPVQQCPPYPLSPKSKQNMACESSVFHLDVPIRFCRHCALEQPLRCRHCPDCNRCVLKFDHHCPWVCNCIGERNHSAFVVFLFLQLLMVCWTAYLACASMSPRNEWSAWSLANGLFVLDVVVLVCAGVPITALLAFHIYLALYNRTTWESVAYNRIVYLRSRTNPFDQGCCRNCYWFCCSRYPFGWDRIYAESNVRSVTPVEA